MTFQPSQNDRRLTDVPSHRPLLTLPPDQTDGARTQTPGTARQAQPDRTQTPRTLTTGPDYPSGILGLSLAPAQSNSNTLPSSSLRPVLDSVQHVNQHSHSLLSHFPQRHKTLVKNLCESVQISPTTYPTTTTSTSSPLFDLLGQRAACHRRPRAVLALTRNPPRTQPRPPTLAPTGQPPSCLVQPSHIPHHTTQP